MKKNNLKASGYFLLICIFVLGLVMVIGSGGGDDESSENAVIYEKVQGLALTGFGNSMLVYSGGSNTYDLVFSKEGTYTKKRWSDKSKVSGTWVVSGNDITMTEEEGSVYTLTANTEGIVKDGMSVYVNGESGSIAGVFNEISGTGTGVLDMCYTDNIGRYKVELQGDTASIVMTFNDDSLTLERDLLAGGNIENSEYDWTCDDSDVILTKTGSTGTAQDISHIEELWWVEGSPVNLYFLSDSSYVGYMVTNIDYLGE